MRNFKTGFILEKEKRLKRALTEWPFRFAEGCMLSSNNQPYCSWRRVMKSRDIVDLTSNSKGDNSSAPRRAVCQSGCLYGGYLWASRLYLQIMGRLFCVQSTRLRMKQKRGMWQIPYFSPCGKGAKATGFGRLLSPTNQITRMAGGLTILLWQGQMLRRRFRTAWHVTSGFKRTAVLSVLVLSCPSVVSL